MPFITQKRKFSITNVLVMVTFTEEIRHGKLQFLCSDHHETNYFPDIIKNDAVHFGLPYKIRETSKSVLRILQKQTAKLSNPCRF